MKFSRFIPLTLLSVAISGYAVSSLASSAHHHIITIKLQNITQGKSAAISNGKILEKAIKENYNKHAKTRGLVIALPPADYRVTTLDLQEGLILKGLHNANKTEANGVTHVDLSQPVIYGNHLSLNNTAIENVTLTSPHPIKASNFYMQDDTVNGQIVVPEGFMTVYHCHINNMSGPAVKVDNGSIISIANSAVYSKTAQAVQINHAKQITLSGLYQSGSVNGAGFHLGA